MGLRERNAARTRGLILDTALRLFREEGYEATTMEQVAEQADIGTSTLYRYFASKDLLVLEPLALRGQMASELRGRPPGEALDVALGHALRALVSAPRADSARLSQVKAVVDVTPSLQARLAEEFRTERTLLERAVAERLGRPADDTFCVVTARLATVLLEMAVDVVWKNVDEGPVTVETPVLEQVQEVLERVRLEPPVVPRIDAAAGPPDQAAGR